MEAFSHIIFDLETEDGRDWGGLAEAAYLLFA
jgi:hypothetical protein